MLLAPVSLALGNHRVAQTVEFTLGHCDGFSGAAGIVVPGIKLAGVVTDALDRGQSVVDGFEGVGEDFA